MFDESVKQLIEYIKPRRRDAPPLIVAISGLPGSGKTTLALRLAGELGPQAMWISEDDFITVSTPARREFLEEAIALNDWYPFHDKTVTVTNCGRLCIYRKKINLSSSLAGQAVGIKEADEGIWLVSFMQYDLGYIDLEEKSLQPLDNPFGSRIV